MTKYKILIDKEKCIGCGACSSICNNFEIVGGKSKTKKSQIDEKDLKANKEAANICPVQAIKIK